MTPDFALLVDSEARILEATGHTGEHIGLAREQLLVQSALSFFEPRSRKPLSTLLKHGPQAAVVTLSNIKVVNLRGGVSSFHISITRQPKAGMLMQFFDEKRDLDPEDFAGGVVPLDDLLDRLSSAVGDIGQADARLVLLEINDLANPAAREKVEETLTKASLTGAVGSDGKGGYGLLTGAETSDEDLRAAVIQAGASEGLTAEALGLRMDSMAVGDTTAHATGLQGVFGKVLRRFRSGEKMAEAPNETLGGAATMVRTIQEAVLKALKAGKVALRSLPITDLTNGAPAAHYLEPILDVAGKTIIPVTRSEITDSPEISAAVDLAVVEAAGRKFNGDGGLQSGGAQAVFVPLLPATLRSPDLARNIVVRLKASSTPHKMLGLRLEGLSLSEPRSRAYRTMQALTQKGHPISFPDFLSALDGIRRLSVKGAAMVEAPGHLLVDLSRTEDGRDTLRRLGTAWSKSNVSLLANPASTADREYLAEIGVPYARFQ